MRTLYLGLPLGALALARAGFWPSVAVSFHRDAPGHRRVRRELGARGSLLLHRPDLEDPRVVAAIASARPDVLLSWFWPRKIPAGVRTLCPRGAFGTHPSLLPRWRGPDPYFHVLRAGDPTTGVTLHRLEETYDTGAVVERVALDVHPSWNSWRLARALDKPALELLVRCATRLAAGEALEGTPQDERLATLAPEPSDDELAIDWHEDAASIVRLVRAAAPDPGAVAAFGETVVVVLEAAVHPGPIPPGLDPGEAVRGDPLVVVSADGGVAVSAVRLPDGRVCRGPDVQSLVPTSA